MRKFIFCLIIMIVAVFNAKRVTRKDNPGLFLDSTDVYINSNDIGSNDKITEFLVSYDIYIQDVIGISEVKNGEKVKIFYIKKQQHLTLNQ